MSFLLSFLPSLLPSFLLSFFPSFLPSFLPSFPDFCLFILCFPYFCLFFIYPSTSPPSSINNLYLYFMYWLFLLSKGQIDQWNVTEPNVEEEPKTDVQSALCWYGPQQELGLQLDG
jgi:hypothetical protein